MRHLPFACLALLAVAQPATARDHSHPPEPASDPAQWIAPDDYPPAALRNAEQGRVVAELAIDAMGRPTDCRVVESSGYPDLDAATCMHLVQRALFKPALDARGKPVAGTYRTHGIRWTMPSGPMPVPVPVPPADAPTG
ncbi:energy transducer TonB [Sphingomonas sp. CLY1604]|uniref:energy transducer TonB n=1 Tax=Sphingomonas sp. CLY1604 TaxID=3457786 RepID=UPI003FD71ED9